MRIYVPSRGRYDRKFTHGAYSPLRWVKDTELAERTVYCVRNDEMADYKAALRGTGIRFLNCRNANSLGAKRDMIAKHVQKLGEDKFMMSDDDTMLYIRKSDELWNLRYPEPDEVVSLMKKIEKMLTEYAMVGISPREGNNRHGVGPFPLVDECTRSMRLYAFRTKDYCAIEPNRLKEMADIDTTLQLLRQGKKNAVIYYWAQGQPDSNTDGGCSIYRTAESHDKVCRQLVDLHPGFVTLRQKKNKGDQKGFGTRTEVTVQWKKAYKSSGKEL
jgi:hypothetical protein